MVLGNNELREVARTIGKIVEIAAADEPLIGVPSLCPLLPDYCGCCCWRYWHYFQNWIQSHLHSGGFPILNFLLGLRLTGAIPLCLCM